MSASARLLFPAICLISFTLASCFARTSSSIRILEQSTFHPEAQTETCQISGIVLDENKLSLPGIRVKIWSGQGMLRDITDNTGRFSFFGLDPGSYRCG